MSPNLRKFTLTSHITFSVGWLGAVAGFLAIALAGVTSQNPQIVRSSYLIMELVCWYVIVPCSLASFLTGVAQSLGTHWGLFKHYWIIVKLLLTLVATVLLLVHMRPITFMADIASEKILEPTEQRGLRIQLVADAVLAMMVLLVATILSVYKPWGKTKYAVKGQYNLLKPEYASKGVTATLWRKYALFFLLLLFVIFIIKHLAGGAMGHH